MQLMPWRSVAEAGIHEAGCVGKLLEGYLGARLIENGGSTLAKNGTQNRDTDTHGGISELNVVNIPRANDALAEMPDSWCQ